MEATPAGGKSEGRAKSSPREPTFVIIKLPNAFFGIPSKGLQRFKVEVINFKQETAKV